MLYAAKLWFKVRVGCVLEAALGIILRGRLLVSGRGLGGKRKCLIDGRSPCGEVSTKSVYLILSNLI